MAATLDLFWVVGGRIVTALVALATIRLSSALLSPEQYGLQALLVVFQVFCGLFLVNPVGQYINRHTHSWADDGTLLARLSRYRIWVIFAALTGSLASGSWAMSQQLGTGERIFVMAIVMLMVVSATWNATWVSLLNMLGYRAQSTAWGTGTVLLALFFSFIFTKFSGSGLAWFAGQATGMAIGAIGSGLTVRSVLPERSVGTIALLETGALRTYILPLGIATGFMWWLLSGYRLLIEAHWGLGALGKAVVGLSLAAQVWSLIESLAMQFLFPMFYRRIASQENDGAAKAFEDLLNTLGPIYLVLAAATLAAAPALLLLLVDAAYGNVVHFVFLGAVVECFRALGNILASAAQVNRRMSVLVPPYALGALVMTVGITWMASNHRDVEPALAMLAVAGAGTLLMISIAVSRLHNIKLDVPRWLAALALAIATGLSMWKIPLSPKDVSSAIGIIVIVGLLTCLSMIILLWRNSALSRLLAVRLINNTTQGPKK